MKKYTLHTIDLSTSLVFYRALFGRMPAKIQLDRIEFETPYFHLSILEKDHPEISSNPTHYPVMKQELVELNKQMRRFTGKQRLRESCEEIKTAIGLSDPDGNRWIIGETHHEVEFEKCYVQQLNIH